jgi:CRP-like cAMP-binding protein
MLRATAQETPGVLGNPVPDARTLDFAASSVTYELRVFIADYEQLTDVRNELMSRIWYAAKRSGIQIPYPITTIHKTEIPYQKPQQDDLSRFLAAVSSAELFKTLSQSEATMLAHDVSILRFGIGEELLREGESGDFFFLVVDGTCSILVNSAQGSPIAVASVGPGGVVGEMSLLAGTPRAATVRANSEVLAARIGKTALSNLLAKRQDLLQSFAHYTAHRSKEIEEARLHESPLVRTRDGEIDERALGERIKRFLGLVS